MADSRTYGTVRRGVVFGRLTAHLARRLRGPAVM